MLESIIMKFIRGYRSAVLWYGLSKIVSVREESLLIAMRSLWKRLARRSISIFEDRLFLYQSPYLICIRKAVDAVKG